MPTKLDSAIVRKLVEIGTTGDPLMLVLVTYVGAAFHASLFGGTRAFMAVHQEKVREVLNSPPRKGQLTAPDMKNVLRVSHELELVYRLAVLNSYVNNLTSYALATRPSKAVGSAQIKASVLLGKTRAEVVNQYIARRTKSLSRENFGTRIQVLKEITETDFALRQADLDHLKRLSNLRNAMIHEGSAYQFTVDEDMRIHRLVGVIVPAYAVKRPRLSQEGPRRVWPLGCGRNSERESWGFVGPIAAPSASSSNTRLLLDVLPLRRGSCSPER